MEPRSSIAVPTVFLDLAADLDLASSRSDAAAAAAASAEFVLTSPSDFQSPAGPRGLCASPGCFAGQTDDEEDDRGTDAAYYARLLLEERDSRLVTEGLLEEERRSVSRLREEQRTVARALEEELQRMRAELREKELLFESDMASLTVQLQEEREAALREHQRLAERLRQSDVCQRSLLKEVSSLLLEREALRSELAIGADACLPRSGGGGGGCEQACGADAAAGAREPGCGPLDMHQATSSARSAGGDALGSPMPPARSALGSHWSATAAAATCRPVAAGARYGSYARGASLDDPRIFEDAAQARAGSAVGDSRTSAADGAAPRSGLQAASSSWPPPERRGSLRAGFGSGSGRCAYAAAAAGAYPVARQWRTFGGRWRPQSSVQGAHAAGEASAIGEATSLPAAGSSVSPAPAPGAASGTAGSGLGACTAGAGATGGAAATTTAAPNAASAPRASQPPGQSVAADMSRLAYMRHMQAFARRVQGNSS